MSDLFQLPVEPVAESGAVGFGRYGLDRNPFPDAGIESGVLFVDHIRPEMARINSWLQDCFRATGQDKDGAVGRAQPVRPLAISGSLGAGKTHVLHTLAKGLGRNANTPALRKPLTEEKIQRLNFSDLFLRHLPLGPPRADGILPIIAGVVEKMRAAGRSESWQAVLSPGSPLEVPLRTAVEVRQPEHLVWLSRWIRREHLTSSQMTKLGVSGVLPPEGQAIRVVADLLRVARWGRLLQVWFLFIDQWEELWRIGVLTPSQRAKILTDLRLLIDQSLEGAPIALLLAWNTTVETGALLADPAQKLQEDYRAVWERLGEPVTLPLLPENQVWPFAKAYLKSADVTDSAASPERRLFYQRLEQGLPLILERLRSISRQELHPPRRVLAMWRENAERLAFAA